MRGLLSFAFLSDCYNTSFLRGLVLALGWLDGGLDCWWVAI